MKIIDRGIVFWGCKGSKYQSAAFPQICITASGRWICGFRAAPTKLECPGQEAVISWSDDQGKSWNSPISPFGNTMLKSKTGNFRSVALTPLKSGEIIAIISWVDQSDPSLDFFCEETQGLLDTRIFSSRSKDNGETWSPPELIDTSPYNVPTPTTGPILELENGELACQFELNKHYYDISDWHHHSMIMFSKDKGKNWTDYVQANDDPANKIFYWDQRPNVMNDGRILNLFWTYDNNNNTYLNIHGSESINNGRTWTKMWDTKIPGQPAPPIQLANNLIVMVYVDRTKNPIIKARASKDFGYSWPEETEIVVYAGDNHRQTVKNVDMNEAWAEMGAFSIGLPATTVISNEEMLVVYYAGPKTAQTGIHWVRIASS